MSKLTRRAFVTMVGLAAGTGLMAACGGAPAATTAPAEAPAEATAAPAATAAPTAAPEVAAPESKYKEAPMLAEKVAAGELPPVEERLPVEPLIVTPIYEVGQYSGDLRRCNTTIGDAWDFTNQCHEALVTWDYTTGEIQVGPNLASSWTVSEDGSTYVFNLRPGLRWSDGEPFTADDILFWYEDLALNQEYSPTFTTWLKAADEPVVITKVDDYTVEFKFAAPYGLLLDYLAFRGPEIILPKHYLSQFHPTYADADELAAKVKDAGYENWYQLLAAKDQTWTNPDRPTVSAWKVDVDPAEGRVLATRNPYYWKVDTEGQQLPYFDRFTSELVQQGELALMRAMAGEVDYQYRHMGFANYSLLLENEEKGNYTVLQWTGGSMPVLFINMSVKDDVKRQIFSTKDFRHALSYAMNREEMNDLFWFGLGTPMNPVSRPGGLYWQEGYGSTAIEYDPDKANELLDGMGLDKRDSEGYRIGPDGKRVQFILETYPAELGTPAIDIFTQMANYWRAVGLDAQAKEVERSLWSERVLANEVDMPAYGIDEIHWTLAPDFYVPYPGCYWGVGHGMWYASGGKEGVEPLDEVKQLMVWFEELKVEPDAAKREELGHKILDQHNEQIYMLGAVYVDILPMIKHNTMMNVMEKAVGDYTTLHESISYPFQMWRKAD